MKTNTVVAVSIVAQLAIILTVMLSGASAWWLLTAIVVTAWGERR